MSIYKSEVLGHVTHLQRISGHEGDIDDVRLIEHHGVDESVLPLDAVLPNRRVTAVEVEP